MSHRARGHASPLRPPLPGFRSPWSLPPHPRHSSTSFPVSPKTSPHDRRLRVFGERPCKAPPQSPTRARATQRDTLPDRTTAPPNRVLTSTWSSGGLLPLLRHSQTPAMGTSRPSCFGRAGGETQDCGPPRRYLPKLGGTPVVLAGLRRTPDRDFTEFGASGRGVANLWPLTQGPALGLSSAPIIPQTPPS